jgi:hypothetical protein
MGDRCHCGTAGPGLVHLGCLECGAACCPACAVPLESATYCGGCAAALLETATVRAAGPFDL